MTKTHLQSYVPSECDTIAQPCRVTLVHSFEFSLISRSQRTGHLSPETRQTGTPVATAKCTSPVVPARSRSTKRFSSAAARQNTPRAWASYECARAATGSALSKHAGDEYPVASCRIRALPASCTGAGLAGWVWRLTGHLAAQSSEEPDSCAGTTFT